MTSYLTHGATLALAWFLIVNGAASMTAIVAAHLLRRRELPATFWFALRLTPVALSAAFVAAVFAPSYWQYEPPNTAEGFDLTLTTMAVASLALAAFTLWKGAAAWVSAVRRERVWMSRARAIGTYAGVPAFEIDADAPLMALAGIVRPRLIVTALIAKALSGDEMHATIAHEIEHWRAWDNLKRLAMRAAPDVLGVTRAGRAIERRWASAAEHAADHHAGGVNPEMRCALASALVKVARMMPVATPAAEPISTLIGGGDIASRVERLLDDRPTMREPIAWWGRTAMCALVLAVLASYPAWLVGVHELTETLVRSLP